MQKEWQDLRLATLQKTIDAGAGHVCVGLNFLILGPTCSCMPWITFGVTAGGTLLKTADDNRRDANDEPCVRMKKNLVRDLAVATAKLLEQPMDVQQSYG